MGNFYNCEVSIMRTPTETSLVSAQLKWPLNAGLLYSKYGMAGYSTYVLLIQGVGSM